jgi:hypothetical protein
MLQLALALLLSLFGLPARAATPPFLRNTTVASPIANDPVWEKRWWLEKTVRLFRAGEGLRAGENPDDWLRLAPAEIIAKLTADPRFGDLALDFNLYFLGFKPDSLRGSDGHFSYTIFSFPSALESARALSAGGDYLRLFDLQAPAYLAPLVVFDHRVGEESVPNSELFERRGGEIQAKLRNLINFTTQDPLATVDEVCAQNTKVLNSGFAFFLLGIPFEFVSEIMFREPAWYLNVANDCLAQKGVTLKKIAGELESAFALNARLFTRLRPFAADGYGPRTLSEILPLDLTSLNLTHPTISWGEFQRRSLTNSSTNMNRKRAAYVLKHYYCDDLTPIGVESGPAHGGGGPHGTDQSCKSCHYKLDPMAGYFRGLGKQFLNFSSQKNITFDDDAKTDLQTYLNAWRAPLGSGREWNVGYVRSVTDESLNDYGSELSDLHADFRKAPEVKACLVKRFFQYAVGEDQVIDPGYLAGVSAEFSRRASTDSSDAFRWLAGQAALSRSFRESNPESTSCYDFAPGVDPAKRPPCRVAFLLEKNCIHCHKTSSSSGSLGLKDWISGPDGRKTFPHLGEDGKQLTLEKTLGLIVDRLSMADPELRMPSSQYMSAQDRQALFLWAQDTLAGLQKRAP